MEKNNDSRLRNTLRNFGFGAAAQLVVTLLGFVSRTVFIRVLGMEYSGVNGLYTSILDVLSLTELGLADVVVFSLYKPLAEGDEQKLTALMGYYKVIYRYIALAVGVIGLCLVPILRLLVKSEIDQFHLVLYYLMFLANSVCSYLLVYKSSIIQADQKRYLISKYTMLFKLLATAAQILVLLVLRNFTVYLAIQISMTIANNFYISRRADKLYPFLREKAELPKEEAIACTAPAAQKKTVVVISADHMGEGNEELGRALLKAFLFALTQQETLPAAILFYNAGAAVTCEGSASLEDLQALQSQGVEILTCGTCLNYYGLTEKLRVGEVTNMYVIAEKQLQADCIIRP